MNEKRMFKRSDLNTKVKLQILTNDRLVENTEFYVDLVDVSGEGIGFISDRQLLIGECFRGKMTLWTKETLEVIIKIVRSEEAEDGFHYGGIFVGLNVSDAIRIKIYQLYEENEV